MNTFITIDIALVAKELTEGNIAGIPTETVYGLGANALNDQAVAAIYDIKQRPRFNPIIVHVNSAAEFKKYAEEITDAVYKLAEKFSPGPITFILKKKHIIPDIVTAGNNSVGLRIPKHQMFTELLEECGFPIAAPSANMFGRISPTTAGETLKELHGKVRYILDGGKCEVGIESTVISFLESIPKIMRHGGITKEEIEQVVGKVVEGVDEKTISPGMSEFHYAPRKRLFMAGERIVDPLLKELNAGFLDLDKFGSLKNIAVNLFSELRKMDESDCGIIVCTKVEDKGIGIAINDRLERACSGRIHFEHGMPVITQLKNV
jgi:L-threonylcarbamoyladenylate synthase